ncbi:hypothetical protein B7486_25190 [cyanobacterium TDX16]|nr:hypothetical protein B7486_25190 [cyanobacterium TDX16]
MNEHKPESFFRAYDLTDKQKQPKEPAAHQHDALNSLQKWYQTKHSEHGGILVLPTGGGTTITAMRFLCTHPLSEGYKVLWLAHTHHLLEQALYSLESEVKLIRSKQKLNVRVVSGTTGHFRPSQIQASDDVLICTLQTITRAYNDNNKVIQLENFLKAAGNKLFVVFDEAHHSPAPSYCRFIRALREDKSNMYLLGLTATPTHSNEKKVGWLKALFPQGILYQISPKDLIATGVLAKPIFETSCTTVKPEFDENKYKQWVKDFRDLPEEIITKLAENQERNAFIAKTYAENRERYGKTIIFTDRWFQCEQLSDFIKQQDREIKVGTVYTHIDADSGSADARNKRSKNENAEVLEKFRDNELDVLINVRMLTEGTDVPNVQSIFLTRQTTSQILMTQMVGRALRGVKFGGTKEAYIVSFIDDWQQTINWAEYKIDDFPPPEDSLLQVGERVAMQLISIDLVRRLIEQMDSGENINIQPFLTFMPIGWYRVEIETCVEEKESTEIVQRLVMVFEHEKADYENFIEFIKNLEASELKAFIEPVTSFDSQLQQKIEKFQEGIFANFAQHIGGDLLSNLFYITCHIAQNDREAPDWFDFQQRQEHDLDAIAQDFLSVSMSDLTKDEKLYKEYNRDDRYWKIIYQSYKLFKSQYNACVERLLNDRREKSTTNGSTYKPDYPPLPEPSDAVKRQVKKRDNYHCLCCGENTKKLLQIDHIVPKYYGGFNEEDNLQTLCKTCNQAKGTEIIDFRIHQTLLTSPQAKLIAIESHLVDYEKLLRRSINFFYKATVVESVKVGGTWNYWYNWELTIHPKNNPRWMIPHLTQLLREIKKARLESGYVGPNQITITAPGFDVVAPIKI